MDGLQPITHKKSLKQAFVLIRSPAPTSERLTVGVIKIKWTFHFSQWQNTKGASYKTKLQS